MNAISGEQRRAFDDGAVVVCAADLDQSMSPAWFDARHWGAAAQPVAEGGRGSAWFIHRREGDWLLRHCRRGGLVARLSPDRYVWAGEASVRSVAEFRLLQRLIELGLPVPRPVAALYMRRSVSYRAALIVERIAAARPLTALLDGRGDPAIWSAVGHTLAHMHSHGVDHADLNANNILINAVGVWLIDFDRGRIRAGGGAWQQRNLARLQRSLEKLGGRDADAPWRCGFAALRVAYDEGLGR